MRFFAALGLLVCFAAQGATLTGTVEVSAAAVDLPAVGTLDWRRWGTSNATGIAKGTAISVVTVTGGTLQGFTGGARIIGDGAGIALAGIGNAMQFTLGVDTGERRALLYLGNWNSTCRLTVTLAGATTYVSPNQVATSPPVNRLATLTIKGDAVGTAAVRWEQTAGAGDCNLQAAALQVLTPSPPPPPVVTGEATLTWGAVTMYTDGTPLANPSYAVYAGQASPPTTKLATVTSTTYTAANLATGLWYFGVKTVTASGVESVLSNIASKQIAGGPPPDPCVADPLRIVGTIAWPTSRTGRRTLTYDTGTKQVVKVEFVWPGTLTITDTRGCTVTATK